MKSLTVTEFGRLVGLPKTSAHRLMRLGRGPETTANGRKVTIPVDSAIAWIEGQLRGLYRDKRAAKHADRLEAASRALRIERVMEGIRNPPPPPPHKRPHPEPEGYRGVYGRSAARKAREREHTGLPEAVFARARP
jgi:hypothetical protein